MTKIGKKAAQDFFCAVSKVFDRVKTVETRVWFVYVLPKMFSVVLYKEK
jgi:hypothetical protein